MPSRYEKYATHHTSRRLDEWDYTRSAGYFVTMCTHGRLHLFGEVEAGRMFVNACGRIVVEEWHRTGDRRDRVALDAFVVMPNHVHGILWIVSEETDASNTAETGDVGDAQRNDAARDGTAKDDGGTVERNVPTANDDGSPKRSVTARRDAPSDDVTEPDRGRLGAPADGDTSSSAGRQFGQPQAGSLGTVVGAFKSAATRRINQHRGTPGAAAWQRNYHERIIRTERHLWVARRYIRDNPAKWYADRLQVPTDP